MVLLQILDGMLETFGIVGLRLGFGHTGDADNEVLFGDINAAIVLDTHH